MRGRKGIAVSAAMSRNFKQSLASGKAADQSPAPYAMATAKAALPSVTAPANARPTGLFGPLQGGSGCWGASIRGEP
jgi:hypothetical protein